MTWVWPRKNRHAECGVQSASVWSGFWQQGIMNWFWSGIEKKKFTPINQLVSWFENLIIPAFSPSSPSRTIFIGGPRVVAERWVLERVSYGKIRWRSWNEYHQEEKHPLPNSESTSLFYSLSPGCVLFAYPLLHYNFNLASIFHIIGVSLCSPFGA